jgi:hypothetical protein
MPLTDKDASAAVPGMQHCYCNMHLFKTILQAS